MSVEPEVIVALVEDGGPKRAYQAGFNANDFTACGEEFSWIEERAEENFPIGASFFKKEFPDFAYVQSKDSLSDLLITLKQERAYLDFIAALDEAFTDLRETNVHKKLLRHQQALVEIQEKLHEEDSTIEMEDYEPHLERIKQLGVLRRQGIPAGIPTGLKNVDFHWGGLQPGRLIVVLGRPGDGKSFFIARCAAWAKKHGYKVGLFSPEMNEFEHRCRIHTLLSADPEIQKATGIKQTFRNRSLMEGAGFNVKTYRRFCQFLQTMNGEIHFIVPRHRREKMTTARIEATVEHLGLDFIIVDPLYKLKPLRSRETRLWELQEITDALQSIGEKYNIPVMASNQAHRQSGNRGDAPHKDSSFGSDAPVQMADHVIGVKFFSEEHMLLLRCTKNRFGGDFRIEVKFFPNIGIMEDISPLRQEYSHDDTNGKVREQELEDLFGNDELTEAEEAEIQKAGEVT